MSRIRSKNTSLDRAMRSLLRKSGIHYQSYPKLTGHPDFLVGNNVVVFCDSSFWHGKNWLKLRKQLSHGKNAGYWIKHIATNRSRDRAIGRELSRQGYWVLRFWDIDLNKRPGVCLEKIRQAQVSCDSTQADGKKLQGSLRS